MSNYKNFVILKLINARVEYSRRKRLQGFLLTVPEKVRLKIMLAIISGFMLTLSSLVIIEYTLKGHGIFHHLTWTTTIICIITGLFGLLVMIANSYDWLDDDARARRLRDYQNFLHANMLEQRNDN